MFPERFQRAWWAVLLTGSTLVVLQVVRPKWVGNESEQFYQQYAVFLVWVVLLLVPLFAEISVLGIGVKRQLRALQKEVKRQAASSRLYWLGNDLASLRFQAQVVRPLDENQRLVSWQGQQALGHARACRLPQELIEKLDGTLQAYCASPPRTKPQEFAQRIMELQKDVSDYFARQESD